MPLANEFTAFISIDHEKGPHYGARLGEDIKLGCWRAMACAKIYIMPTRWCRSDDFDIPLIIWFRNSIFDIDWSACTRNIEMQGDVSINRERTVCTMQGRWKTSLTWEHWCLDRRRTCELHTPQVGYHLYSYFVTHCARVLLYPRSKKIFWDRVSSLLSPQRNSKARRRYKHNW